jgi:hypothetical protein
METLDSLLENLDGPPCITILGDPRLPSYGGKGFTRKQRKAVSRQLAYIIKKTCPSKVYVIPNKGVNALALRLLATMSAPVTLVNPHFEYCEKLSALDRIGLMKTALVSNVITLTEKAPNTLLEITEIWKKTMEFVADRSQIIIYIHGEERSPEVVDSMEIVLRNGGGIVIDVNYDNLDI